MRHAEGASAVRSAAKHRSDSVARSTPTLAQQGARPKLKSFFRPNIFYFLSVPFGHLDSTYAQKSKYLINFADYFTITWYIKKL
ncbi:MAG: hypothetical protein NZ455_03145 [Bacteroidia bacterium]|nr:hypothetical protein [Bacteroidia bacterium]MDW8348577.1 hypothetical protein [Bacteroidia bacterium]